MLTAICSGAPTFTSHLARAARSAFVAAAVERSPVDADGTSPQAVLPREPGPNQVWGASRVDKVSLRTALISGTVRFRERRSRAGESICVSTPPASTTEAR